jgi:hypothetical protein
VAIIVAIAEATGTAAIGMAVVIGMVAGMVEDTAAGTAAGTAVDTVEGTGANRKGYGYLLAASPKSGNALRNGMNRACRDQVATPA